MIEVAKVWNRKERDSTITCSKLDTFSGKVIKIDEDNDI